MIQPLLDYILVDIIKPDTGVISAYDSAETNQYGKVIAVGEGVYEFGQFVVPKVEVGDLVYFEAFADGTNVPKDIRDKGQALIKAARIMAVQHD